MTEKLSDLPNIGKELEKLLMGVEINSPEDLKKVGSVIACTRLKLKGEACYSKLYALEGAIQGVRWHALDKEHRTRIKKEFDEISN